jgi:hypothetical protein
VLDDDVTRLMAEASALKSAAFANSTKQTYRSQTNSYLKFCLNYRLQAIPASQETLCSYVAFLSRTISSNSVKGYLNAVRILHLEAGLANPLESNWELNMITRGFSRLLGKPPKQKLPITIDILLDIQRSLSNHPLDRAFWTACLIAYFGFLRKSTLLPSSAEQVQGKFISRADVVNFSLNSFFVNIRFSKTIQFGQRVLSLPYVSCADVRLCPVRALLTHLGTSSLGLSRPLFNFVLNGVEIQFSNAMFMKKLRDQLRLTGHPASQISCHSFRRGEASLAYMVGLSATDIKLRGDWKSNAYERYLCIAPSTALQSACALSSGVCSLASGK